MDAGAFRASVKELEGPENPAQLTQTLESVLGDLNKRVQGGESHDLSAQLPQEHQSTVTIQTDAQPTPPPPDDVDGFLRGLTDQFGNDPKQTRTAGYGPLVD